MAIPTIKTTVTSRERRTTMMTHLRTKLDEEDERDADDEEMDAEYDEHGMSDWRQGCKNEEYKNEEDVYEDRE